MRLLRRSDLYLLTVVGCLEAGRGLPLLQLDKWLVPLLSTLAYHTSTLKRQQTERNLKHAYGETLDDAARPALTHKIFLAFWQELFEWTHDDAYFSTRATVRGIEHLQAALARGKGVILWESSPFGNRIAAPEWETPSSRPRASPLRPHQKFRER